MSASITFNDPRRLREFFDLDSNLHAIFMDFVERCWPDATHAVRITSIHRTDAENNIVGAKTMIHVVGPPWRAIDIGAGELNDVEVANAAARINALWQYDPTRPTKLVCFTEPHGTGPHFHLQCCPLTRRR